MQDSGNFIITQSTLAGESTKNFNKISLIGIITTQQKYPQYVNFSSILPISIKELNKYMICLCEQIIEIKRRNINIELISLKTLNIFPPSQECCYYFFFKESDESQNFFEQILKLLNQFGYNDSIFSKAKDIQDIVYILFRLYDDQLNDKPNSEIKRIFQNVDNCRGFGSELLNIDVLESKEKRNVLYQSNDMQSSVFQISKPDFINCEDESIVIKIAQKKEQQHQREIEILESFCEDIHYKYYGYFRFEILTMTFFKFYKQTFSQFQQRIRQFISENPNDNKLIQQVIKRAYISIIQQLNLIHKKHQIIHRDLKPQNIMIDSAQDLKQLEDYLEIKCVIIDFDCSIQMDGNEFYQSQSYGGGTSHYVPPESCYSGSSKYTESYDIYQVGVIFLETIFQIDDKIFKEGFWNHINKFQKAKSFLNLSDNLLYILTLMISQDPIERPSLKYILQALQIEL
ncbi:unnamed protein product [Paramecium sonneborni]|uniref:Protein kinase domain-containing protein n=1 Tax=Paramecium sonneborni TaxID=65129 RepID=A0A8S1LQY6_9CILI|nr:unnamed protein product [Paramecium sonneborni]